MVFQISAASYSSCVKPIPLARHGFQIPIFKYPIRHLIIPMPNLSSRPLNRPSELSGEAAFPLDLELGRLLSDVDLLDDFLSWSLLKAVGNVLYARLAWKGLKTL